ncbi:MULTISPECIES: integrase core domain-containing protein [unclassified Citromicrobium]|uniref:integrase core domain-containing protein n=1 Tax=unclassified Citromicrobium TaxID=2630544 RepID=UPI0009E93A25
MILDFCRLGKPTDNAFVEAFFCKLRSECLNAHWFINLQDACEKLEAWRKHHDKDRSHGAIGNVPRGLSPKFLPATSRASGCFDARRWA